jgi:pyruvate,water dikinase
VEISHVPLSSSVATDVSLFGAKVANLAKAAQLGFDVPKGLAIPRLCTKDEFKLIAQEIIDKLSPLVAVRSSATKEDSETKAFAGQFETCLGIGSTADLITAFETVKSSGSTALVKSYNGEVVLPEQIGVLIQCMVNATRAGVAFSRDPVTGESKVIIDSNYGLGKSVVDGDVTPDSIEYMNGEICQTFVGRKSIQITLTDSGISTHSTSSVDSQRCSLTNEEIVKIAGLAQKVEHDLGFAADIEWAIDAEGILWLLQARPITTINRN